MIPFDPSLGVHSELRGLGWGGGSGEQGGQPPGGNLV